MIGFERVLALEGLLFMLSTTDEEEFTDIESNSDTLDRQRRSPLQGESKAQKHTQVRLAQDVLETVDHALKRRIKWAKK